MIRRSVCLLGLGLIALVTCGCDGGGDMSEGVPANVDMSKDFTPKVEMPGMSKKAATEAKKKAAAPTQP